MSDFEKGLLLAFGGTAASAVTAVAIGSVTEGEFSLDGPTMDILVALVVLAIGVFFVCCAYRGGFSDGEKSKEEPKKEGGVK